MHNLTNYHSHCTYCDGKSSAESFVVEAIKKGFYSYGISSHAPLPFETNWSMNRDDLDAYVKEISDLKGKYANEIELYIGLEIDYLDNENYPNNELFSSLPLDYRIGSVHMLHDVKGDVADLDIAPESFEKLVHERFENDLVEVVKAYFRQKRVMVEKGGIDFVGHIDKISYNATHCEHDITKQKWYVREFEDLLESVASYKTMIEVNTKAFHARGCFFPNIQHFGLIRELNIPVLVNSDSHLIEKINDGRREALQALKRSNIDYVMELRAGHWIAQEINFLI